MRPARRWAVGCCAASWASRCWSSTRSARDELVAAIADTRRWLAELESAERARTGIRSLKVGYNQVFGYYLEVTHPHRDRVPADYVRKQTLANAERFITPQLKEAEARILHAEE